MDVASENLLQIELRKLVADGHTILCISHRLPEVKVTDYCLEVRAGNLNELILSSQLASNFGAIRKGDYNLAPFSYCDLRNCLQWLIGHHKRQQ